MISDYETINNRWLMNKGISHKMILIMIVFYLLWL